MKKFIFQAIILILVIIAALIIFTTNLQFANLPFTPQTPIIKQLQINNTQLKVEIADTQAKRSKGLGGRQGLGQDEGMLFVFSNLDKYSFWMKGITFPLDFIWIKDDKVAELTPNVQPPVSGQQDASLPIFQPNEEIDKVLEVNAGTIERLNIKVGDTIKIE